MEIWNSILRAPANESSYGGQVRRLRDGKALKRFELEIDFRVKLLDDRAIPD